MTPSCPKPNHSRSSLHINELESLPGELGGLPLEALSVFKNRLTQLPPELFAGLAPHCSREGQGRGLTTHVTYAAA
jgi:hypothetical protein